MFSSSFQNALEDLQMLIYCEKKQLLRKEYDEASLIESTKNKKITKEMIGYKLLFQKFRKLNIYPQMNKI